MAIDSLKLLAQQSAQAADELASSLLSQRQQQIDLDVQTAGLIGDLNKQLAGINATFARDSAIRDAAQIRRETKRSVSSIRAGYAAAGVVTTEGSAFLAQVDQVLEGAREEQKVFDRADIDIMNSQIEIQKIDLEQGFRKLKAANIKQQDLLSTQAEIDQARRNQESLSEIGRIQAANDRVRLEQAQVEKESSEFEGTVSTSGVRLRAGQTKFGVRPREGESFGLDPNFND